MRRATLFLLATALAGCAESGHDGMLILTPDPSAPRHVPLDDTDLADPRLEPLSRALRQAQGSEARVEASQEEMRAIKEAIEGRWRAAHGADDVPGLAVGYDGHVYQVMFASE